MGNSAGLHGADLTSPHSRLPTSLDATEQYLAAIDEWLWEIPESATAALALTEFAGFVTADRFLGEVLRDQIIAEERDAFYQTVVISAVANWMNKLALRSLSGGSGASCDPFRTTMTRPRPRGECSMNTPDPFALGGFAARRPASSRHGSNGPSAT